MTEVVMSSRIVGGLHEALTFLNKMQRDGFTFNGVVRGESREYDPCYLRDVVTGHFECDVIFTNGQHYISHPKWADQ